MVRVRFSNLDAVSIHGSTMTLDLQAYIWAVGLTRQKPNWAIQEYRRVARKLLLELA